MVNILTWWGYLSSPWIEDYIEEKCAVTLSYDEYYSNTEFLRRWRNSDEIYDIVIFTDTIYDTIKNSLHRDINLLQNNVDDYNEVVKQHYYSLNFSPNILYFYQSIAGFLWNPDNIYLSEEDDMNSIFNKAGNKKVILMDDPPEASFLVTKFMKDSGLNDYKKSAHLLLENFMNMIKSADVYIMNDFSPIYKDKDFAFSYLWSGQAFAHMDTLKNNYRFLVHPRLSNISSDMIAVLNDEPGVMCAAEWLSSEEFLNRLQNDTYYFSPYVNMESLKNDDFKKTYQIYINKLSELPWVESSPRKEFIESDNSWKAIVVEQQKRRNKNN